MTGQGRLPWQARATTFPPLALPAIACMSSTGVLSGVRFQGWQRVDPAPTVYSVLYSMSLRVLCVGTNPARKEEDVKQDGKMLESTCSIVSQGDDDRSSTQQSNGRYPSYSVIRNVCQSAHAHSARLTRLPGEQKALAAEKEQAYQRNNQPAPQSPKASNFQSPSWHLQPRWDLDKVDDWTCQNWEQSVVGLSLQGYRPEGGPS